MAAAFVNNLNSAVMLRLFKRRIANNNWLFSNNYIEAKGLYLYYFNYLPCVSFIADIDIQKAYSYLNEAMNDEITEVLQHCAYNHDIGQAQFNVSILVLTSDRMIEVGGDYIMLLHRSNDYNWANATLKNLSGFRTEESKPNRIGFVQTMN
jgi:hypothetical protein